MAKKRFLLGILVMALVFGMTVAGCDNGAGGGKGDLEFPVAYQNTVWEKTGDASTTIAIGKNTLLESNGAKLYTITGAATPESGYDVAFNTKQAGLANDYPISFKTDGSGIYWWNFGGLWTKQ